MSLHLKEKKLKKLKNPQPPKAPEPVVTPTDPATIAKYCIGVSKIDGKFQLTTFQLLNGKVQDNTMAEQPPSTLVELAGDVRLTCQYLMDRLGKL